MSSGDERYGLSWAGKAECVRAIATASAATLVPAPERSVGFEAAEHAIIDGDNLEVLKVLRRSYAAKVKMIYIDPPYNTGRDRIYADDYTDPLRAYLQYTNQADERGRTFGTNADASGRYHSKWLSMMYPRLALARELLRDDGLIFVSCDDCEVFNLRLIMNELFGEPRFCGVIKRRAARKPAFLSRSMSDVCDYVVVYAKGALSQPLAGGDVSAETRPVFNAGNLVAERILPAGVEARCADGVYAAGTYQARSLPFTLRSEVTIRDGRTVAAVAVAGPWRINQRLLAQTVYITRNFSLRRHVTDEERLQKRVLGDLLDDPRYYNENGSEELAALFGERRLFDNPKPVALVQHLMEAAGVGGDDIVLDFFAGSGTTAHATLALNARDGGRRRFVLVQLPEATGRSDYPTIADITIERVRRAIADLGCDEGFRVFMLGESSLQGRRDDLALVFEILLQNGHPLSARVEREVLGGTLVYRVSGSGVIICLERTLSRELVELLSERAPKHVVLLERAFAGDDQLKVNALRSFGGRGIALQTL